MNAETVREKETIHTTRFTGVAFLYGGFNNQEQNRVIAKCNFTV